MEKKNQMPYEISFSQIEKPEISRNISNENLFKEIGREKIESLKNAVSEINLLIKERENLSQILFNECEKIKTEINNFVFENEALEENVSDPRDLIKEKNNLRHKKIEISEMQLNEKVSCWKDVAVLKKELRENERELAEKEERLQTLNKFLEEN
jgi:DNA repair exonuclease SbcCD ATPase subunit